jgi:hypothetical protein
VGEERKFYRILVEMPKGKRSLGRPRRRWEDGIRMDFLGRLAGDMWSGFNWLRIGAGNGLL